MPELPEVETVRRKLESLVLNSTIKEVEVYYTKYNLIKDIKNQKINEIKRLGKWLIFILDDYIMLSHLRMEGKYFYKDSKEKTKHDLVCFSLSDGKYLYYNDVRKFGMFFLFDINEDIYNMYPLNQLGKEPFIISSNELYDKLHKTNNSITLKEALLDQSVIAGLGNIYVDEVLYECMLNPKTKPKNLTLEQCKDIIEASIKILNKSINDGGSTIKSFTSLNEVGHFQTSLKVHLRENERCYRCNSYIIKTRVGGRGTYYCPVCQKSHDYKLIGITGSFSSGKSTFTSIIKSLGYETYSLDDIYHELDLIDKVLKKFKAKDINDLKLKVFNDENLNNKLKEYTHPLIMKELFNRIEYSNSKVIYVEVPLLFESGFDKSFDNIITVYRDKDLAIQSALDNGYSESDASLRFEIQMDPKIKCEKSDIVVYNNLTRDKLKEEAIRITKLYEN